MPSQARRLPGSCRPCGAEADCARVGALLVSLPPPGVIFAPGGRLTMLVWLHMADHKGGASPVQGRYHASGKPWTAALTLPHGCKGLSARQDGGVVDVSRALAGSPRAPRIHTQCVARSDPSNVHNCLPSKTERRDIVGIVVTATFL